MSFASLRSPDRAYERSRSETPSQATSRGCLTLDLQSPEQLSDALDKTPFGTRRLDEQVERYIVDAARDMPRREPIEVAVTLPRDQAFEVTASEIADLIRNFFQFRADQCDRELGQLFRDGRSSLLIGIPVFVLCLLASQYIKSSVEEQALAHMLGESLVVLAWVANWQPIQIFLYSWWPILRKRRLYQRLASARVTISDSPAADSRA